MYIKSFMSQVLVQKLTKMSDILDDCIKTNKVKQVRGTLGVGNLGCAMGAYALYHGAGDDPAAREDFLNNDENVYMHIPENIDITDKQVMIDLVRDTYKIMGKINFYGVTCLNDNHKLSFAEFRDIFRGMGQ